MANLAAGLVTGGIGAIGSAVGSGKQANATRYAANQESSSAANSLAFNKEVYGTTLANEQPYVNAGDAATSQLNAGLADGSLTKGYGPQFSFSGVNLQNDPAFNFDLQQGQQAIQRSAAAGGGLVSGGALKDLNDYSQGYAANQYQQSYANALAAYNQAYGQYETTQANTYNRLAGTAGLGQNAVTQTATSGNAASGTVANVNANTANSLSGLATSQGNAGAAATMAGANALAGSVNSAANYFAQNSHSSYGGGTPLSSGSNPNTGGYTDANGNFVVTTGN